MPPRVNPVYMGDVETQPKGQEICPFCGLPIEPGQETATVKGKRLHFACYQEESGGAITS